MNCTYNIYIYERYKSLKESRKAIDNYDLAKIFEYFTCIKLTEEYGKQFYEYDDILPEFKEENNMSRSDTGIDCCDIIDTIVQCKLRKEFLNWKDCSTFFGSQNIFCPIQQKAIVRWPNLIISRNSECKLSDNLLVRTSLFIDKNYPKTEILNYCENLIENPPEYPKLINEEFKLRNYQEDAIKIIKENTNTIISIPTGCGKNVVIIHSFEKGKRYLILVPRIILMDQLKEEITKHKPFLKNKIQLIGDNNNKFDDKKEITICVFNSVAIVEQYAGIFEKIFVDEAHHIYKPEIYEDDESIEILDKKEKIVQESDEEEYSDIDELEGELEDQFNEEYQEEFDYENSEYAETDLEDDEEDELKETTNYNNIIREFKKYNNNVYLSATIDEEHGFYYYKKDIREMIENGYLCDYTIHVPVFTDDPTNKNICEYLIKNYRNMIVYCNSQKEGKNIVNLMNKLQLGIAQYIDCKTGKRKRDDIIRKYKEGIIPFLVNVRILVEGFDAPITKGVVFLHLPRSQTTLVQIIGRALRLHYMKKIANIILPFSSKDDEENIGNFLRAMARNDSRIRKAFNDKKVGGYICIDRDEKEDDEEEVENEIELKYEVVYSSLVGLKNGEEIWMQKLEELKKYIDENEKRPSEYYKKTKNIAYWFSDQQKHFKTKKKIMSNQKIYDKYYEFINSEKYRKYFLSFEEKWFNNFNNLKKYIDENGKRPKNSKWLSHQLINFKNKKFSMSNQKIYNFFNEFLQNDIYKKYFISNIEDWLLIFEKVKIYIDTHKMLPYRENKEKDIQTLANWINAQKQNFKTRKNIMVNENIYNLWDNFIKNEHYKEYFVSHEEEWYSNLEKTKEFIDKNNKRPSIKCKNIEERIIGIWLCQQTKKYMKDKKFLKNKEITNIFSEFINNDKYKFYFMSNEELWKINFNNLKGYIDQYNKRPSLDDDNLEIKKLAYWLSRQQTNYRKKEDLMSHENIYNLYDNFIKCDKYKKYFVSNEEEWYNNFIKVKKYIDDNRKRPSCCDKNKIIQKLGVWIITQNKNYIEKIQIMSNLEIFNFWNNFINDEKYKKYFITSEEEWKNNLKSLKSYIDINKKRPSSQDINIEIKQLNKWLSHQVTNYNKKQKNMSNPEINQIWTNFIEEYKEYF